jgi:hypothetical protein
VTEQWTPQRLNAATNFCKCGSKAAVRLWPTGDRSVGESVALVPRLRRFVNGSLVLREVGGAHETVQLKRLRVCPALRRKGGCSAREKSEADRTGAGQLHRRRRGIQVGQSLRN